MTIEKLYLKEVSPETYFSQNLPKKNKLYLIENSFIWQSLETPRQVISLHYFTSSASPIFPGFISIIDGEFENHIANHVNQIESLNEINDIKNFFKKINYPVISNSELMEMSPVHVKKPWGREIWYTGIEKRGISDIIVENKLFPLSDLIKLYPQAIIGHDNHPILIKILDPLSEEIYGDLYVELHEKKEEVYVVTNIDEDAWADGIGYLKYGLNEKKVKSFSGWDSFKIAYKNAAKNYEQVRRKIDQELDKYRIKNGLEVNDPVSPVILKKWITKLNANLLAQEKTLRKEMDSFSGLYPLKLGDVVKVDTLVPHSLQHGIRTVEFQTPVYERLILSFAQKVLTQDHWDSEKAIDLMREVYPNNQRLEILQNSHTTQEASQQKQGRLLVEKVADFRDFKVTRVTLAAGNISLSELIFEPWTYSFVFGLWGNSKVKKQVVTSNNINDSKSDFNNTNVIDNFNESILTNEKCLFFPRVFGIPIIEVQSNYSPNGACFLIAYPKPIIF